MSKQQHRQKLALKNGALADARHALNILETLRAIQRVHPEKFCALVAIANGRADEISPEQMKTLTNDHFLAPGGNLSQGVTDVLLSALADRDNSLVLLQPFRLETDEDKRAADEAQKQNVRALVDAVFGADVLALRGVNYLRLPMPGRGFALRRPMPA